MLSNSDNAVKRAYTRMLANKNGGADETTKPYAKPNLTNADVDAIIDICHLTENSFVIDFGCGNGRHTIRLAQKKIRALGIDYIVENVNVARINASKSNVSVLFETGDCREYKSKEVATAIICLYDVIGSFSNEDDNIKILQNIYDNLQSGGTAIISVMNAGITNDIKSFSFSTDPNAIFKLEASQTMETTGNVFDSSKILFDTDSGKYYRREQFNIGQELPEELIVCDRRYTADSIRQMCESVGLIVTETRYVRSGKWDTKYTAKEGKEILVVCTKP